MGDEENSEKDKSEKSWLEQAQELHDRILAWRGGKLIEPSIADTISRLRQGLCDECGRDILDVAEQVEKRKREVMRMAEEQKKAPHKARISRARRIKQGSWIEEARKIREQILARRGGVPLPTDSGEIIRESREQDW